MLDDYSAADFQKKPAEDSWSVGQLYVHLVKATLHFHLKQIETCLSNSENAGKSKAMPGRISFLLGGFPPTKIKVPASDTYTPKQPADKNEIKHGFNTIREALTLLVPKLKNASSSGKTPHPAMGHLNATEWFRLIEMHFRHHLRQKKRLDAFLSEK